MVRPLGGVVFAPVPDDCPGCSGEVEDAERAGEYGCQRALILVPRRGEERREECMFECPIICVTYGVENGMHNLVFENIAVGATGYDEEIRELEIRLRKRRSGEEGR